MTIKDISKTFFAKLAKFQKNTKTSVRDSDSVNVNVCNYAKNNDNGPIVLMKGITCRFGNLIANQNITFDLKKGEIHALLGENGAGKTTLTSMLYGLYQPESGEIYVKGQHAVIKSPSDAINLGIAMVHQHFLLTLAHSVTENIIVGLKSTKGIFLNLDKAEEKILQISKKYGLKIDPKSTVGNLSVGEQQRVEIIKGLYRNVDILILDEPTGMLTPMEEKALFEALRSMVNQGLSIIFITHKLREVMEVSNRITVLRGGNVVGIVKTSETSEDELARMMVGRTVSVNQISQGSISKTTPPTVLEIKNVSALGNSNMLFLKDIRLDLRKGEILGIAGVDGNGQNELAEVIAGLRKVKYGEISMDGRSIANLSPRQIRELGLSYVPEDCLHTGLILEYSIIENLVLDRWYTKPYSNKLFLNKTEMMKFADKIIADFEIKITELNAPVSSMSGGNLQKIVLGREFSRDSKVLVVHNPTRGLDIGATEYIHKQLIKQKENGVGVLLLSLDLDEILTVSDRIGVIYEGKIITIVEKQNTDIDQIGLLMGGKAIKT
ncbi:MAG: ABC transporter ATP-binding protein [Nitrososphaeraceae archaeon]